MRLQADQPAAEVKRLQRCINDLASMLALPALWSGGDANHIGRTLIDVLRPVLRLELAYLRLNHGSGDSPAEMAKCDSRCDEERPAHEVGAALILALGDDPQKWPTRASCTIDGLDLSLLIVRMGLRGELGTLVAAADRADFPTQTEELLLRTAANQAILALHEVRLRNEQRQLADELDHRVAERTEELAAANRQLELQVSLLKQSQEALRNTQADLANMTRIMTMGQLTASIAHEVNQPLAGIITNASTCLRMLDADPPNVNGARETARRTIRDGNRASDVIARLRALFSRRQAIFEPVDLNEAAREVIALLSSKIQANGVALRSDLADPLPRIAGDRVQLQQVIMNLLQNAADATANLHDRPRHILIRTELDEAQHVRLTVRDSGVGIDPQAAGRLFDAFYTTKDRGMGIGLAVSRWIIDNHHGRIWAAPNDDGPGTTFSLSLPAGPAPAAGRER